MKSKSALSGTSSWPTGSVKNEVRSKAIDRHTYDVKESGLSPRAEHAASLPSA
jgi:hypothetical protein